MTVNTVNEVTESEVRELAELAVTITDTDAERDNEVTDLSENQVEVSICISVESSHSAKAVCDCLIDVGFAQVGVSSVISSDQGTRFAGGETQPKR